MAGSAGDYHGSERSSEVIPSLQSMESLAEWRSGEQVENCIPSTSPYWDTDDNDNDLGSKPSDLYGKFTWKIENFSHINKKELRSNEFTVGGYKWYILIYPQGCDVSNHLSLFLCVANHDKLLPGWSHFAQFTISVVHKDLKKSKYSDTLHRFWKKEHDWGWKKFIESTKVKEGFLDSESLTIKAQVQVIREKTDRPFLCLDRQYRAELVRVYLTNVEQICRRFFEEKRAKLLKLIEDKARWSSFCEFWLSTDEKSRHNMYREKADTILKVVVKHFFVEKEVTSTLVMDSLYSGLKALECESRSKNGNSKSLETEETPAPIVRLEEDMFVLVDDVLGLLQRVSLESRPPKDEKGPQNRTKDGNSGEDVKKDAMEPDERRLTELGRRTVEIFVLGHIFSNKILAAFEEAVALKMQEELIKEEEEAGKAVYGQKAKRAAIEKEKRAKRKQGKHKRKNRKGKDKAKDDKFSITIEDEQQGYDLTDDVTPVFTAVKQVQFVPDKPNILDDVSDISDTGDDVSETVQPESEDRDTSTVNWDTDTSEVPLTDTTGSGIGGLPVQNGRAEKKKMYSTEDSSSTCSTESAPSVVMNCSHKGNKTRTSPRRGKCRCGKETKDCTANRAHEFDNQPSEPVVEAACQYDSSQGSRDTGSQSEAVLALKDQIKWFQRHSDEKEVVTVQQKLDVKGQVDVKRPSKQNSEAESSSFSRCPTENLLSTVKAKVVADQTVLAERLSTGKRNSTSHQKVKKVTPIRTSSSQVPSIPKSAAQHSMNLSKSTVTHTEKITAQAAVPVSRPSSAPLVPPRPFVPVVSTVQTTPSLARSVSASGRLANGSQSYKNAIMGNNVGVNSLGSNPSTRNPSAISSQPINMLPSPLLSPQRSGSGRSGFTFGSISQDVFQSQPPWLGETSDPGTSSTNCDSSLLSRIQNIDIHDRASTGSRSYFANELPPSVSSHQTQSTSSVEDFPHLDMINHLLDEEQNMGRAVEPEAVFQSPNSGYHHPLNQQYMYQNDNAMQEDVGPPINYMYDQPSNYYDAVPHAYGVPFDATTDAHPQAGSSAYENEFPNGALQHLWEMNADHFSFLNAWTIDDGSYHYQYQVPEYANLNGYMYLSSDGL